MYLQFEGEWSFEVTVQREVLFSAELKESSPGLRPDEEMYKDKRLNENQIVTEWYCRDSWCLTATACFSLIEWWFPVQKDKEKKQAAGTFNPCFFAWVNFTCMSTLHT